MVMVRLTVRTPEGVWQDDVDSWTGLAVLAALSAEPESFAELVEALFMRSLNRAYGSLRASQDAFARDSAAQEFRDALEVISGKFPGLTAKCADLQSRLDEVLRRIS
jgi:hypothetical protein